MFCKYCGSEIDTGSTFCSKCGKRLTPEPAFSPPFYQPRQPNETNPIIIETPNKQVERPKRSVTFVEAIKNSYINYANFKGRAVPTEYWYVYLYHLIVALVLSLAMYSNFFDLETINAIRFISHAWSIVHLIPGIAVTVRRLHDTGHSAAYYWFMLIPIAGPFIFLYRLCCSSDYDNAWGLSPYNTLQQPDPAKPYTGYSATTKDDTHIWMCRCGARVSVSPCPFCGKKVHQKVYTEQGLRDYIAFQMAEENPRSEVRSFYGFYLHTIYNTENTSGDIEPLKHIIDTCHDYFDSDYVPIVIQVCENKLTQLNHWRCKGCGTIHPLTSPKCNCGYTFNG